MNFKLGDIITDKAETYRGHNYFKIVKFENSKLTVALKAIKSKTNNIEIGKIYRNCPLSWMILVEPHPRIVGHHLTAIFK